RHHRQQLSVVGGLVNSPMKIDAEMPELLQLRFLCCGQYLVHRSAQLLQTFELRAATALGGSPSAVCFQRHTDVEQIIEISTCPTDDECATMTDQLHQTFRLKALQRF